MTDAEPLTWDRIMWAVLWDTQPDNEPRARHFCVANAHDGHEYPALFATKREAQRHINRAFDWCRSEHHRKPPQNNRLPKPVRVRVRITMLADPD